MDTNLQVRIRALPRETPGPSHFERVDGAIPEAARGEVLVRNHLLSLDPYMRKRLADAVAGRVELRAGDLMMGRTVGEVVESRDPDWPVGDWVLGWGGWQHFSAEPGVPLGVMHVARLQDRHTCRAPCARLQRHRVVAACGRVPEVGNGHTRPAQRACGGHRDARGRGRGKTLVRLT